MGMTPSASTSARSWSRSRGGICFEFEREGESRRVTIGQASGPYLDAIDSSEPDGRTFGDKLPELVSPGSGDREDDCGDEAPALFCPDCGEPQRVGRTCRRSRCPRCWQSWAFQRAKTMASKLEALRADRARSGESEKFHHLTVSFRPSTRFDSGSPLDRGIEAVKALVQQVDVHTGYLVYHPYRIREEYRGEVNGHESGSGDMAWKDVLEKIESEEWSWEAVRDEFLVYGPHFHVIALSDWVETTPVAEIEERTGVVIHRVTKGPDSSVSMYGIEDLAKVTAYSLSHGGLMENNGTHRAAYRAFGDVANFSATPQAEAKVDDALREVAGDILGVEFPKARCSSDRVDEDAVGGRSEEHEHDSTPPSSSSSPSSVADGGRVDRDVVAADVGWSSEVNTGFRSNADELWSAYPTAVPSFVEEPPRDVLERCGATLRPMFIVDEYLDSDEWIEEIDDDALERLRAAREEWADLGKPAPEELPPPPG